MRILRIYRIVFSFALLGMVSSSCSDLLDAEITGTVAKDDFYKNRNDLNGAAIGMYAPLAEMPHQFLLWGSARADMVTSGSSNVAINEFVANNVSETNPYLDYSNLYKSIVRANRQMENVHKVIRFDSDVSEYDADAFYAEALAIRTLCYYHLVRTFKSFPLILTDPTETLIQINGSEETEVKDPLQNLTVEQLQIISDNLSTSFSREEVWAQIYKDAIKAYGLMPDGYKWTINGYDTDQNYIRMNKEATAALLVEIALWQGDYGTAIGTTEIYTRFDSNVPGAKDTWVNQFTNTYSSGHTFLALGYNFSKSRATNKLQNFTSPVAADGGSYFLKPNMNKVVPLFTGVEVTDVEGVLDTFDVEGDVRAGFSYKTIATGDDVIWKFIGTSTDSTSMRAPYESSASWPLLKSSNLLYSYALAHRQVGRGIMGGHNDIALTVLNNIRNSRGRLKFDYGTLNLNSKDDHDVYLLDSISDANLDKWFEADMSREFAFEGQRWYQLMLLSKLSGENLLAPMVAAKYPIEMQPGMLAWLSDENNWYLPRPKFTNN